jgi:hypothetical protein
MDNLLLREREKLDKVSKDALEQLIFKDNIIEDLRLRLNKEQLENVEFKSKISEYEEMINLLEDKLEKAESYCENLNNKNSQILSSSKDAITSNKEIEILTKHIEELKLKSNSLQSEVDIWKGKNKSITEIEEIHKIQMEQLKKKAESTEVLSRKLKDKENDVEEIISRYNLLQNEYEKLINSKDYEIKELKLQLNFTKENNDILNKQINQLNQNSNTITNELFKEVNILTEKNKDLEMKLLKNEQKYKDEVFSLKKVLEESTKQIGSLNEKINFDNQQNQQDSSTMKVEDLATSLSKSIKQKIEMQNKKISEQNIEILTIQYELEKLRSDLKYEKELNEKLQGTLADLKFKHIEKKGRSLYEEAQVQTNLKSDDIDSFKIKAKIFEDNLIKANEELENIYKKLNSYKEENLKLNKKIKEKDKENNQLVKKIEKIIVKDRSLEKELLTVNNISKLNMTVSALKLREIDLLDKLGYYEEREKSFPGNQQPLNANSNLNYNYNYNQNNQFVDNNSHNNSYVSGFNNNNTNIGYNNNNLYNKNHNNLNNNTSNNHNYSQFNSDQNNNPSNLMKDLLTEKYELENKRLNENNFFLKEENFKLKSESNKHSDFTCELKSKIISLELEKENLNKLKSEQKDDYEKLLSELRDQLEKNKDLNNQKILEMNLNLQNISELNTKLSQQFSSLQDKFYVQSQLIQEKNIELQSDGKLIDSLKIDNEELIHNQTKLLEKLKNLEKTNLINMTEKEKLKKEFDDTKINLNDFTMKNNYLKNEMEERINISEEENKNLRETIQLLKNKIQEIHDEIKDKENKIISGLKQENKEIEEKMRREIYEIRIENDKLLNERSVLRLQNNEFKYEIELLREKNNLSPNKYNNIDTNNSNNSLLQGNINVFNSNSSDIIKDEKYNFSNKNTKNSNFMNHINPTIISSNQNKNENNDNLTNIKNKIFNSNNNQVKEIISDNRYLEQENDYLKNEINKIQTELEVLSKNYITLENNFRETKLEYEAVLVEKDKIADLLHKKEIEMKEEKLEHSITLNLLNNQQKKLDEYSIEINVKQSTINKLIDNIEDEKFSSNKKFKEADEEILQINNEKIFFKDKYENLFTQYSQEKEKMKENLFNLQKENEILISDLNKNELENRNKLISKEQEINELRQNLDLNKSEKENLYNENLNLIEYKNSLEKEVNELGILALDRLEKQNEKLSKGKIKQKKLVELYESHIKYLKNKFDGNLHDFILSVNFKAGNLSEKDAEKFKNIMKNLENTSELINQISGREALIVSYKEEIKNLKSNLNRVNESFKKLQKEKDDLADIVQIRKLKIKAENSFISKKSMLEKQNLVNIDKSNDISQIEIKDLKEICKECIIKNSKIEKLIEENINKNIEEKDFNLKEEIYKAELTKFQDMVNDLNEEKNINIKFIETLRIEKTEREKEILELNKNQKNEVNKIIEELKKIKEKWISPDKYSEKIDELENKIKSLKGENTRKNDMINTLKTQISHSNTILQAQVNLNTNKENNTTILDNNNQINLEEKVKSLQKDLNRKDNMIKEIKGNLENIKISEKKLSEENSNLTEKIKINKIDISRKDDIIKDYKDKINILNMSINNTSNNKSKSVFNKTNTDNSSVNNKNIDENFVIKKLKLDIERKDDIIKLNKAKLEIANNEIEQLKTNLMKNSKNNYGELEKEQKKNENLRLKIDQLLIKNENFTSVIRRIFKDLIFLYEKNVALNKNKLDNDLFNENKDKSQISYKEGMDILNINQDELNDYLGPNDYMSNNYKIKNNNKDIDYNEKVNFLLESEDFNNQEFLEIFNKIKNKIFENANNTDYKKDNVNNNNFNCLGFNNFINPYVGNIDKNDNSSKKISLEQEPKFKKYQDLLNKVKDNNSIENPNLLGKNNYDSIMKNLLNIKK